MIKFSIVIPLYNGEKSILSTLNSCFQQSHQHYEIIVVDDCSTDSSLALINEKFSDDRLKIISLSSNQGVAKARNVGWENATGDYIAFLDSDDLWHSEKLSRLNDFLSQEHYVCLGHLYTHQVSNFKNDKKNITVRKIGFWNLLARNYFNTSCLVVKTSLDYRFDERMRYTEDHELLLRISNKHTIPILESYLTLIGRPQLSKGGLSGNKWKMRKGEIQMYFSAVKCKKWLFVTLPFLISYSLLKHIIKIYR